VVLDDATPFREAQSTGFIPGDYADARAANAAFVVQHARDLEVSGLRIHWPVFPTPDWNMYVSNNADLSPFWKNSQEAIRKGEKRVGYHVLWARDAEVAVGGRKLSASEPGLSAFHADAASSVIW
ncbi:hypothetical protein RZS08_45045, partial [Arthrospira platensis SPKY1]|nr:hypothetical protein [Arthrospira platensis SPKY1]